MTQPAILPLTYPDAVCVDDVDPNGNETLSDLQTLAQDVYHLLLEVPGSNLDDPTRGIGVVGYLSGTSVNLLTLPSLIDGQLAKDDRIDSSQTTVVQNADLSYTITIQLVASGAVVPLSYLYSQADGLVPQ